MAPKLWSRRSYLGPCWGLRIGSTDHPSYFPFRCPAHFLQEVHPKHGEDYLERVAGQAGQEGKTGQRPNGAQNRAQRWQNSSVMGLVFLSNVVPTLGMWISIYEFNYYVHLTKTTSPILEHAVLQHILFMPSTWNIISLNNGGWVYQLPYRPWSE